jgi:ribonuclease D
MIGARLGKEQQWTDWLRRPLAPAQLTYAASDVLHLPAIAGDLRARLEETGRLGWVVAECDDLAQIGYDAAHVPSEDAWRDVSGARALDDAGRTAARRLAAWRVREAIALNKPPSWLVNDKALLELAKTRPTDERGVSRVRGLGEHARRNADALIAAIAAAAADVRAGDIPSPAVPWGPPGQRAQLWEEVVVALVQSASVETGIAPRWLATRGDAEDVARALDARRDGRFEEIDHPVFTSWRRDVIGRRVLAWLRGELALVGDAELPAGVRVVDGPGSE